MIVVPSSSRISYCKTSDNKMIPLHKNTVKLSKLLQSLLEISVPENNPIKIPFPEKIIAKINLFCEYYISTPFSILPMPLTTKLENIIDNWYKSFLNDNADFKFNLLLIRAAHYLQITELVNLLSAWISSLLMEHSPQKLEEIFDLTPIIDIEECHNVAFYAGELENNMNSTIDSETLCLSSDENENSD